MKTLYSTASARRFYLLLLLCWPLAVQAQLSVSISTTPTCFGAANGLATAVANGGLLPYAFNWDNGADTAAIDSLAAGVYTVTVTDGAGATAVASATIATLPAFDVTSEITPILCAQDSTGAIALEVQNGATPYLFQWSNGADSSALSGLDTGSYAVTITDASGCAQTADYLVYQDTTTCDTLNDIISTCLNCPQFMPDNFTGIFNVAISCAANNDLADPLQGLCGVRLQFDHEYLSDLQIVLRSPAGQLVELVGPVGFFGATDGSYWDVQFLPCSEPAIPDPGFSAVWNNNQPWGLGASFSGTYYPSNGCLEAFHQGPVNGVWEVFVTDAQAIDVGNLYDIELIFCDTTAIDSCTGPVLQADFTVAVQHDSVLAYGQLSYATGFVWTFNGNMFSTDLNPLFIAPGLGTFTLTLTAWNGTDTIVKTVQVTITSLTLQVSLAATDVGCFGAADGTITATAFGGTAPYLLAWSHDASDTTTISGLVAGEYSVTVTDAVGETATATTYVAEPLELGVVAFGESQLCTIAPDGQATAVVYEGTPPYTYLWNTGDTSMVIDDLSAGTYEVTVTDSQGCVAAPASVTINFFDVGIFLLIAVEDASCTVANGGIGITPGSGQAPYTYLWNTGDTTDVITGLAPGTYSVVVTDANGCQGSEQIVVGLITVLSLTSEIVPSTCYYRPDGSISLNNSNGNEPLSFQWSNGASSAILSNVLSGAYAVTITDATGCTVEYSYQLPSLNIGCPALVDTCLNCPLAINDADTVIAYIQADCSLKNDLASAEQGLCGVHLRFSHEFVGDLVLALRSPAGQLFYLTEPFSVPSGFTYGTVWDVNFVACAGTSQPDPGFTASWSNQQNWGPNGNYTGSYYPAAGCLEEFDQGPVSGLWELLMIDGSPLDTGILYSADLLFCDTVSVDSCNTDVVANFTWETSQTAIYVVNTSQYATHYYWVFNNDTIFSDQINLTFFAPGPGTYPLTLVAWNGQDTSILTVLVTIVLTEVGTAPASTWSLVQVSPNPFAAELRVSVPARLEDPLPLELTDAYGRVLKRGLLTGPDYRFDTRDLPAAVYFLRIKGEDGGLVRKVLKP